LAGNAAFRGVRSSRVVCLIDADFRRALTSRALSRGREPRLGRERRESKDSGKKVSASLCKLHARAISISYIFTRSLHITPSARACISRGEIAMAPRGADGRCAELREGGGNTVLIYRARVKYDALARCTLTNVPYKCTESTPSGRERTMTGGGEEGREDPSLFFLPPSASGIFLRSLRSHSDE